MLIFYFFIAWAVDCIYLGIIISDDGIHLRSLNFQAYLFILKNTTAIKIVSRLWLFNQNKKATKIIFLRKDIFGKKILLS